MDDCDKARKIQQSEIEHDIANRRPVPDLKARGTCHDCGAPVGPRQLFCDATCSRAFEANWQAGRIRYRDLR